jgi:hypothetical protein
VVFAGRKSRLFPQIIQPSPAIDPRQDCQADHPIPGLAVRHGVAGRYNIGFAKLQMVKDLGFSEAVTDAS